MNIKIYGYERKVSVNKETGERKEGRVIYFPSPISTDVGSGFKFDSIWVDLDIPFNFQPGDEVLIEFGRYGRVTSVIKA